MRKLGKKLFMEILVVSIVSIVGVFCSLSVVSAAEPVKIGFLTSLTGTFTHVGSSLRDGFIWSMDLIGRKAAGRDIQIFVEDIDSNKVFKAMDKARKLTQLKKIDILAGVVGSGSAYALGSSVVLNKKLPFIIGVAGADDLTQRKTNPFIVRGGFSNSQGSHPFGEWAYKKGYRRAVIMGMDYSAGYEHVGGWARTFKKSGGEIIQEIWTPLGTMDYAPYLTKVDRSADVVMTFFAGADALRFVKQYAEYGLKGKIPLIGKGPLTDEMIVGSLGEAADGIVTAWHWSVTLDNPENKAYISAYKQTHGGRYPASYGDHGVVISKMIVEALKATNGNVKDTEALVKAMRSVELKSPRGPVKFDEYGGPIHTEYIRQVRKIDGGWHNEAISSYPEVSQFWKWTPEEYMKMPAYGDMKGKWTE